MLKQITNDIKNLKIQGATNIAYAGLIAIRHVIKNTKEQQKIINKLEKAKEKLANARPNEPMLENSIDYVIEQLKIFNGDLKSEGLRLIEYLEDKFNNAKKQMFKTGKKIINKNSKIFTHCHASSVMGIIKEAKNKIKSVYCTESRPRYQGRITAKELTNAKIPTTLIVDSSVADYIKKADYFLIGCDVISTTNIINKVGSRMISILCDKYDVPLYICTLSYKFNPAFIKGSSQIIEERSTKEVWDKPPRGLKIRNPAFDIVDFENITGFITELGVFPPDTFINMMRQREGKMFD